MELSQEQCFRAVRSKDVRFDGRLFVGIRTTGIYCRPICPARAARRESMAFFACAAAAEEAGFRPCRRCRPEAAPGSPAWLGTEGSVVRALRLIEGGALDDGDVEELAGRLGVTARHLRRLFAKHVGASPRAVAQTRRVHFARALLDETDLPMVRIAECAGFPSVRRFNATFKETFCRTPSELRRRRRALPKETAALRLTVAVRAPYRWDRLVAFLAPRAIPGVESISTDRYRRRVSGGVVEVRPASPSLLEIRVPPGPDAMARVGRARRMFDAAADPHAISLHLRDDPDLAPRLARLPGLRLPGGWDGFEVAVRAILGQQVSVRGATTLCGRLVERFGARIGEGELACAFPRPALLASADVASIGLPRRRAEAIRALAAAVDAGELRFDGSLELSQFVEVMTAIPGIGPWTAHYVAMRAWGEPDAFPSGDLGLRRALSLDARALERRAERWRPWRSYAALALWESP